MNIRTKVLGVTLIIILVTGVVSIFVVRSISAKIFEEETGRHLVDIAELRVLHIKSVLNEFNQLILLMSSENVFIDLVRGIDSHDYLLQQVDRRITNLLCSHGEISRVRILDKNGTIIASSHEDVGIHMSSDPIFNQAIQGVFSGRLHISRFTNNPVISMAAPIIFNGEFSGIIVINLDMEEEIYSAITDRTGLGETGETYLIDNFGYMLSPSRYTEDDVLDLKLDISAIPDFEDFDHIESEVHTAEPVHYTNYNGIDVLGVRVHIPEIEWYLVAEISLEEAFSQVDHLTQNLFVMLAVLLVAGIILSFVISRGFAEPIVKLQNGVDEIMKGNLDFRIDVQKTDEVGKLSNSFNVMTVELKESRKDLEKKVAERTLELKKQFDESEQQRIATLNILGDLDQTAENMKEEVEERKKIEQDLLKRTKEINILYEASQQIGRSLNLQLVCGTLYSLITNMMDCDGMLVSRYDTKENLIHCIYARIENESYDATKFPPIPLEPEGHGTQSIAIRTGEPVIISDWDNQVRHNIGKQYYAGGDRVVSEEELPDGAKHTRSALIIPMKLEGEVFGVIQVSSYRTDAYVNDDLRLLSAISVQVSSSIKNAILYETAQREISERQKAEEALSAEKERLTVTLKSIGDAVVATDVNGQVILMNGIAEELTGWNQEDAIGKHLNKIFQINDSKTGKKYLNSFEDIIATGEMDDSTSRTVLKEKDGLERPVAYVGAPIRDMESNTIGIVLVFRDITPQLKMEEELQQASRLESIGLLAGGLAHDFNNLLTAILGNVSLARILLNPESDEYGILGKAEKASERAKDLTQQLLTFSKGGVPIKKAASIADLIRETTEFALGGSKSRYDLSISEDLWPVEMDEGQIGQVIENLIINADQAMPDGGVIRITAKNTVFEKEEDPLVEEGKYILISIKDKGVGIPDRQIEKIFDPYYTTKQKGSGLGLSIVYSIIKKHDGRITVKSEMGIGTTFRILLPATQKETVRESERKRKIISIKGNILVMDDEEIVLDVAKAMLERFGCTVEVAINGNEAVRKYRESIESGNYFDAVILDLTISGGMGGKQTIIQLLNIDPEVKAIVSSGYSNDPVMASYSEYGFTDFIAKPFSSLELNRKIRKILNLK